jgi:hypothetical protein
MDWVTEHLQLIIAVAGAIAWWLNQRKQGAEDTAESPEEQTFQDPELAENTRRIREEIQRKIEQRRRGITLAPPLGQAEPAEPPPVMREVVLRPPLTPLPSRAARAHLDAQRTAEILEQQASLAEQLRQAQEMNAATLRRRQFETEVASKEEAAAVAVRSALGDDLRNPAALRRAFILREVLGPPLGLRHETR